ncbi:TonB family protein [Sphingobium aromaticiconvertens]|uniref:energy transducer TonB n=1 Tax=Sphingobium aromaticiconvertens TaxID=365341 RepID=UPI003018D990
MTKGDKVMTGWRHGRAMLASGHGSTIGFGRGRVADAVDDSGSRYGGGKGSPFGLGGAIAVHALAVGVFLLVPRTVYETYMPASLTGTNIPIDLPPPEIVPDTPPKADSKARIEQTTTPDTLVNVPTDDTLRVPDIPLTPLPGDGGTGIIPQPELPPIPAPVLVEAQIDARALRAFQPDYPGAMIRLNEEGKVTVRVTIGADGRITDIERLSASNDAFWIATERHARKAWRFRPATRDGVPVTGTKILTVYFKLEGR